MKIRWSPEAAADFAALVEYIRKENSSAGSAFSSVYRSVPSHEELCGDRKSVTWFTTLAVDTSREVIPFRNTIRSDRSCDHNPVYVLTRDLIPPRAIF
jgi:plasmid stabilization system protein ParE